MSRLLVKMVFLVALLCLLVGVASSQDRFCDENDNCQLDKEALEALVDRAYQAGYRRGYGEGYQVGSSEQQIVYIPVSPDELRSGFQYRKPPALQFIDPGTGPHLLLPPGGIPGNR